MYGDMSPKELGKRLWGDAWVDPNTRAFRKGFPPPDCQRTFVQFILEPMYKIYSQVRRGDTWDQRLCLITTTVRPNNQRHAF